jgi:hypothetical protein
LLYLVNCIIFTELSKNRKEVGRWNWISKREQKMREGRGEVTKKIEEDVEEEEEEDEEEEEEDEEGEIEYLEEEDPPSLPPTPPPILSHHTLSQNS